MNTVVALHPNSTYSGSQLALIRRTVATDCNDNEFDLFVMVARNAGLDPFRRQISALVFNKKNPEKRRMSIITGIDGLRAIAARSARYRPDENEPEFTADAALKDPSLNPAGLEKAVVRVYIRDDKGETWRPVAGVAYWDEFAPIAEEWAEDETGRRRPSGRMVLDTKGQWGRMPRVMLAKCAEAQALRKAFPEDLSALYEGAELDRAKASDLTPSEIVGQTFTHDRLLKIGGADGIIFQLFPNAPLESIAVGQVADRVLETIRDFSSDQQMRWFESANVQPLREFWARAPGDALELKKSIEARRGELQAASA